MLLGLQRFTFCVQTRAANVCNRFGGRTVDSAALDRCCHAHVGIAKSAVVIGLQQLRTKNPDYNSSEIHLGSK